MQDDPKHTSSAFIQDYRSGGAPALAVNASVALSTSSISASVPHCAYLVTSSASMAPASSAFRDESSFFAVPKVAPPLSRVRAPFGDMTNVAPAGHPRIPRFPSFSRENHCAVADTFLQASTSSPGALSATRLSGTKPSWHQPPVASAVSSVGSREQQTSGSSAWFLPRFDPFGSAPTGSVLETQRNPVTAVLNQLSETSSAVSATRHLCITNILSDMDIRAIVHVLETSGDIKITYPDFLYSKGILTVSFYDLKEAVTAFEDLQSLFQSDHRYPDVDVCFISGSQISFMYNTPYTSDSDADATLIIELHGANDRLLSFNIQRFLGIWGTLRRIIEIDRSNIRRVLQVEFYDSRAAANFHADLNNHVYQGVAFVICRPTVVSQTPGASSVSDERSDPFEEFTMSSTSALALRSASPAVPSIHAFQSADSGRSMQLFAAGDQDVYMAAASDAETSSSHHQRSDTSSSTQSFNSFTFFSQGHPATRTQYWSAQEYHGPQQLVQTQPLVQSSSAFPSLASLHSSQHGPEPIGTVLRASLSEPVTRPTLRRIPTSSSTSRVGSVTAAGNSGSSTVHDSDPNENNVFDINRVIDGSDKRTTFMIRNIPNKYTQEMLKECIDATHKGTYDFLYLRIDFQNKCNVGYAFINFINVESVISFARERVGKRWNRFNSEKRCSIAYANIQGKVALIEKFRNSTVMEEDPSYRPKIFYSSGPHVGEEEPFPLPTVSRATLKSRQESRRFREASRS